MQQQEIKLGKATINPTDPIEAGSYVTITLTYTAEHPIDDSGYVKICFRHVGDFGTPQFTDPQAADYCKVTTSGDCQITPRWDAKGHTRPWSQALFLHVGRGYLGSGQVIEVVFGDRSAGSPGWQMQTFAERTFEFKTLVDPIATYEFKELPHSPVLAVIAGPHARSLCIAPSQVVVGEPFTYHVKTEDRWGNPVAKPVARQHPGFERAGVSTVEGTDGLAGLHIGSNPIEVVEAPSACRPYWADFHGQSEETIGSNSIEDYYEFGRDSGLLDIVAHQGNDFQITDEFWSKINRIAAEFYQPGRLVTFPGYEWSGNTPLGGDRNVYFAGDGGRISHSSTDLLLDKTTGFAISPTAEALFDQLQKSQAKPFVFAHVGGRYADISMHDPQLEVAMEIHSAWGTFEWLLSEALRRGYRVGVVANSDGHKCRPGASYPGSGAFGSLGGLTCVLAERLDRDSVYDAIKARHCFATTGHRPLLAVIVNAGGQTGMIGDVLALGDETAVLKVRYVGTAGIECIEVCNGLHRPTVFRAYTAGDLGNRIKVVWSGAEVKGRARMARWDGRLTVKDNAILSVTPINFWNANSPPRQTATDRVEWRSSTTGGLAGVILELERPRDGSLMVETVQGSIHTPVGSVDLEPQVVDCGGLGKSLSAYRLPAGGLLPREYALTLPLTDCEPGDNPIYVRVVQEDGHMAWSSPVYLIR